MQQALRVRVPGPLAPYAPKLIGYLADRSYGDRSTTDHVRCLAHVSRWLEAEGLDPGAIDEKLIGQVLDALHRAGKARKLTPWSFGVVLKVLRQQGVAPPAPAVPPTPVDEMLEKYRQYLVVERSLAPLTVPGYMAAARLFVTEACGADPARVADLSAGDVASFVRRLAEGGGSPVTVNSVVTGVRSLLGWFYAKGMIDRPLAQATPWLARARMSTLPRSVSADDAKALLATCDPDTLAGARSLAVLSLLVRLGLRAGEVAAMELGDIDWRKGEVTIRGKGGWRDPLPLPVDVGDALVAYLRRRWPRSEFRQVFLLVRAPRGPMRMSNVRFVVRQACERAGIADTGTHRLRHGAACDMLRHGAPLHEISQVLRHRDLKTTAIYARVDFAALAMLAQPWPGGDR